jgi:hypothetical protein
MTGQPFPAYPGHISGVGGMTMNQYLLERAILYINGLTNAPDGQTSESNAEEPPQRRPRINVRPAWLPSSLARAMHQRRGNGDKVSLNKRASQT